MKLIEVDGLRYWGSECPCHCSDPSFEASHQAVQGTPFNLHQKELEGYKNTVYYKAHRAAERWCSCAR